MKLASLAKILLNEGITSTVFHGTDIESAIDIIKSNQIRLSSLSDEEERMWDEDDEQWGDDDDEQWSDDDEDDDEDGDSEYENKSLFPDSTRTKYPYFLSVARSKTSDYLGDSILDRGSAVVFTLNGRKIGQKYKAQPIDYHHFTRGGNTGYSSPRYMEDEMEDRILSAQAIIPNFTRYITMVEIEVDEGLSEEDFTENSSNLHVKEVLELIDLCKDKRIPYLVYNNAHYLMINNKTKALKI